MSHPAWVRELKPLTGMLNRSLPTSHPAWVRELKLVTIPIIINLTIVAPRVGA